MKSRTAGQRERLSPSFGIERQLLHDGYRTVAGIDEAGRGALAGPLCVGLVVYDESVIVECPGELAARIDDSKKLSAKKRQASIPLISRYCSCAMTQMVPHRCIDRHGITGATYRAIRLLVEKLPLKPDIIIMDGPFRFDVGIPFEPVVNGDERSITIASASIAAKVRRDEVLERFGALYPGYNLSRNKGYGTLEHREGLWRHGPSPIHRLSFEPVKSMISKGQ